MVERKVWLVLGELDSIQGTWNCVEGMEGLCEGKFG